MLELGFLMIVGTVLVGLAMLLSLIVRLVWFPIKLVLLVIGTALTAVAVVVLLPLSIIGALLALVVLAPFALVVGAMLSVV